MEIPTGFVWWSSAESRAAGQVSILAIAETLFAVAFYLWIATLLSPHILLVTSLFVAPLLLLRSERSIAAGVRWFQWDWFGFKNYNEWSRARKGIWLGLLALIGFALIWWVSSYLVQAWLPDQTGLMLLFLFAAPIGAISILLILMVAVAGAGAGAGAVAVAGFAVRAMLVRLAATLRFLAPDGIRSLPTNWRENNFVIDSLTPAELVPGIGEHGEAFTLKGVIDRFKEEKDRATKFIIFLVIPIWFLPVFLYRLSIKATCWFYWPLAFLLRPLPDDDRMERRKHDLCWPWTNPAQRLLILAGLGWLLVSGLSWVGIESLFNRPDWPAVPVWLEYVLILDWSTLEVWDWVNLVIAVTGAPMLFIAGSAVAYYKAGRDYGKEKPWSLPVMHGLWRLRTLAVVAGLLLALGSVLVHLQPE